MLEVDSDTFETEVLGSDLPVLVDCFAEWCGPCHLMKPELEALAQDEADRLKVVLLDTDAYPILTQDECPDIEMLPTCILFVKGREAVRVEGYHDRNALLWEIEPHLKRRPETLPPLTSFTSEY